ncbi:MAG: SO_0444 family Cu/Zn efflux transporter [Candidatus Omnitrophica bacterium]|nr:SO_0444 family Cu/Zn efflux transporter [Candidatus Omnitrophota bacterium]
MDILKGVLIESFNLLNAMSPYLLVGFFAAGLLKVFLREDLVQRHLGTHNIQSIFKAAIFGIPLPLCSCGVIPAALALRKQGASKAAIFSFLISTPTTGVDSILATFALLGGFYTWFRILATFVVAMIVGMAALLIKDVKIKQNIKDEKEHSCPHCHEEAAKEPAVCCSHDHNKFGSKLWQVLKFGFGDLLKDSGVSILLGILIGGLISYFVPTTFVEHYLSNPWLSMLIMMAVGIPMYVCSTGSIPIVAALMMKGLNPGAGFVFLITGPATNAVSFAVIAKEFGFKSMLLFLVSLIFASLLMGWVFNLAWNFWGMNFMTIMHHHHGAGLPVWINYISSGIFIVLILISQKK